MPRLNTWRGWLILLVAFIGCLVATATLYAADGQQFPEEPLHLHPPARAPEPAEFRAVYLTFWSAATSSRVETILELAGEGLVNAVVIDVKDVTGTVAFDTDVAMAREIGAKQVIVKDLEGLLARLHAKGLYVIARLAVFSDPKLAAARPDWAVHSVRSLDAAGGVGSIHTLWRDRRNLAWIDPASVGAWDYNIAVARDALARGFDEINFDYIRFPSDGVLADMSFPIWDRSSERQTVIRAFFDHLRREMGRAVISADLFGLTTVNRDDLGIGQILEDATEYFDYVCPMVYPSHYAPGFIGKPSPAEFPYEVVHYSLATAKNRLSLHYGTNDHGSAALVRAAKLRPWLQDFNLGAAYTPEMVAAQVQAARDSLGEAYCGFILWNPRNVYQRAALEMVRQ